MPMHSGIRDGLYSFTVYSPEGYPNVRKRHDPNNPTFLLAGKGK